MNSPRPSRARQAQSYPQTKALFIFFSITMKMRKDDEEEKVWEEEEERNTKATFKLRLTKRKKTLSFIRNKKY